MSTVDRFYNHGTPVCMYCGKEAYLTGWDRKLGDNLSLCRKHFFKKHD